MLAIIRVRGITGIKPKIRYTLSLLRLNKKNHCVLVAENEKILGMIKKVKDYITWGKPSKETVKLLIEKRGRLTGNKPIPKDIVEDIVNAFDEGKKVSIKPVFRLHPPRKGWKSIKLRWPRGALGPRDDIDNLLKRMM